MKEFHGVYPALITPLDDSDQVNEGVVQDLVDWHLEAGVNGFYVAGGTGEGLLLSLQQRKDLTEAVMRATDGRATVIVHVGSVSTKAAVNLAQHANAVGAGAISAIPPIYYGVDPSLRCGTLLGHRLGHCATPVCLSYSVSHPFGYDHRLDDLSAGDTHRQRHQVQRLQSLVDASNLSPQVGSGRLLRK